MKRAISFWMCYVWLPIAIMAQQDTAALSPADTIALPSVEVLNPYPDKDSLNNATINIATISSQQLGAQANQRNFVSVLNQIPGVQMEERSPGSYRLSFRGSLLRSPFGIRNVKFYLMSDLPITDASGNTYFNLFSFSSLSGLALVKGPDASIFGANSGGVMALYPNRNSGDTSLTIDLSAGSFGMVKEDVGYKKVWGKYSLQVNHTYQRSDGYRRNSQMQQHFVQAIQHWQYKPKAQLMAYHMLANLRYETPGGLTLEQMEQDPTAARAPTATLPGATQQQAGIYNTTTYHGLIHEWNIKRNLRHVVSAWGSFTDFKNPFITNYEVRKEHTLGTRTYIEWWGPGDKKIFNWINGYEYLYTYTDFKNYDNNRGERGDLQLADRLRAQQQFFFTQFSKRFFQIVKTEFSMSMNFFNQNFKNQYPIAASSYEKIDFKPQLMPRFGLNVQMSKRLYLIASISRGYSPPTLAEVRPSTNIINTNLQAEKGVNYELTFNHSFLDGRRNHPFGFGISAYYFTLKDAIVRRQDDDGADFFVNAGGTRQFGAEANGEIYLIKDAAHLLRNLRLVANYNYQHFRFQNYQLDNEDYTGNWLTGVPQHRVYVWLAAYFKKDVRLDISYNYTSKTPLDDANTVYADGYHLLQTKVDWDLPIKKIDITIYLSADNLLNQRYSLGNDINAFGGRYFNPAPTINFYGGVKLRI